MSEAEELYDNYMKHLESAHTEAQKALDALYARGGPKRSLLCRMLLGRAQSILIGLYAQEVDRRSRDKRTSSHV